MIILGNNLVYLNVILLFYWNGIVCLFMRVENEIVNFNIFEYYENVIKK